MFDPVEMAHKSPYFKRNHVGKAVCTLCNIYCNDENAFMRHLSGKTHTQQVENKERRERRRRCLDEEERLSREARAREEQESLAQKLAGATASSLTSSGVTLVIGRFGEPEYRFRTENHPTLFETKVWLDFIFPFAEDGTRPLHRWLSAREQRVEAPPDSYFVYLLVACEGYTTVAVKFPAEAMRTTSDSPMMASWASTMPISAAAAAAQAAKKNGAPASDAVDATAVKNEEEEGGDAHGDGSVNGEEHTDKNVHTPEEEAEAEAEKKKAHAVEENLSDEYAIDAPRDDGALESPYLVSWDPARKVYHLYFVMSR